MYSALVVEAPVLVCFHTSLPEMQMLRKKNLLEYWTKKKNLTNIFHGDISKKGKFVF